MCIRDRTSTYLLQLILLGKISSLFRTPSHAHVPHGIAVAYFQKQCGNAHNLEAPEEHGKRAMSERGLGESNPKTKKNSDEVWKSKFTEERFQAVNNFFIMP